MRRLVVHIGPRKTGSTTIQRMLVSRAASLRDSGVYVPRAGNKRGHRGTHAGLAWESRRQGTARWRALATEVRVAEGDRIVLSAEDFANPWCRSHAARRIADFAA